MFVPLAVIGRHAYRQTLSLLVLHYGGSNGKNNEPFARFAKHTRPNHEPHSPANHYGLWSIIAIYRTLARVVFKQREKIVRILRQADGAER